MLAAGEPTSAIVELARQKGIRPKYADAFNVVWKASRKAGRWGKVNQLLNHQTPLPSHFVPAIDRPDARYTILFDMWLEFPSTGELQVIEVTVQTDELAEIAQLKNYAFWQLVAVVGLPPVGGPKIVGALPTQGFIREDAPGSCLTFPMLLAQYMPHWLGGRKICYRDVHGQEIDVTSHGATATFKWRGGGLTQALKVDRPVSANGLQIAARLSGFETHQQTDHSVGLAPTMAMIASISGVVEVMSLEFECDRRVRSCLARGAYGEARQGFAAIQPRLKEIRDLARATIFGHEQYLPRLEWVDWACRVLPSARTHGRLPVPTEEPQE